MLVYDIYITWFASVARFVQQNVCNLLTCSVKVEVFYSPTASIFLYVLFVQIKTHLGILLRLIVWCNSKRQVAFLLWSQWLFLF